jgi:hypothetical protein
MKNDAQSIITVLAQGQLLKEKIIKKNLQFE